MIVGLGTYWTIFWVLFPMVSCDWPPPAIRAKTHLVSRRSCESPHACNSNAHRPARGHSGARPGGAQKEATISLHEWVCCVLSVLLRGYTRS